MVDQSPSPAGTPCLTPQYADQVLMINNSRDALGIALMDLDYSVNTDSEEELRAAYDLPSPGQGGRCLSGLGHG